MIKHDYLKEIHLSEKHELLQSLPSKSETKICHFTIWAQL